MLKFYEWAGLQSGGIAAIRNEMASLTYGNGLFVMEGPSGIHTLHGDTTDLERLNAHWYGFCADTRNKYPMVTA
jgi:hypothetical protein